MVCNNHNHDKIAILKSCSRCGSITWGKLYDSDLYELILMERKR